MNGIHWVVRTPEQLANFLQFAQNMPMPFQGQIREPVSPKTTQQIRYMHSLCNALAAARGASPEDAKKDAKVEFGVVIVSTSLVSGNRTARLKSFADYSKDEAEAFCTQMEVFLSEQQIEFKAAA